MNDPVLIYVVACYCAAVPVSILIARFSTTTSTGCKWTDSTPAGDALAFMIFAPLMFPFAAIVLVLWAIGSFFEMISGENRK